MKQTLTTLEQKVLSEITFACEKEFRQDTIYLTAICPKMSKEDRYIYTKEQYEEIVNENKTKRAVLTSLHNKGYIELRKTTLTLLK